MPLNSEMIISDTRGLIILTNIDGLNLQMVHEQKKLDDLTPKELGNLFPIEIVPFDKNWSKKFITESELLRKTLSDKIALRIEHFGSTVIHGLSAKPVIDILVEIPLLTDVLKEDIIGKMKEIGYHFIWRTDEIRPYMHFVKGYTPNGFSGNVFHIHMGDQKHPLWDRIYFRDYLINNPLIAKEYELLKISLADKFKFDREAYTNAKSEFVKRITEIAKNLINKKE